MIKTEITRFKVKKGKSAQVDAWMDFLRKHPKDIETSLKAEKMYVETIFREVLDGEEYLYWYSVQGEGGQDVGDSELEVDKKHLEFWNECIDDSFIPKTFTTEVVMIQNKIMEKMRD